MHLDVDRPRCEGYGFCEGQAPTLLHLDDEGELVIDQHDVAEQDADAARSAVRSCPVAALQLTK